MWELVAAAIAGAAWRRWWGQPQDSWLPVKSDLPGIRWAQGAVGLAALYGLCVWAGHPWWSAGLRSLGAFLFLIWVAESIPHIWRAWELVDRHIVSLRTGNSWTNGYTTYGEATCGAIIWWLACALR